MQRHFRHVHRLAGRGTVEDHILHFCTAHRARPLLAEHPSHGVGYVGLTAAIGADDRGHTLFEHKLQVIGKGLEAMDFELRQTH